jgi:DNA-binding LytR/AlgR family response regulator
MRVFEIAICDDDGDMVRRVSELCKQYIHDKALNGNISEFTNGKDLLNSEINFDIVLLDVEMPGINGLMVANMLRNTDDRVEIIFLTNYEKMAREGYKVRALRYVLKSCIEEELIESLDAAMVELLKRKVVILDNGIKSMIVDLEDIYFIESLGDDSNIFMKDRNEIFRKPLKYWESYFGDELFRCHKSYLVNFTSVIEMDKNSFVLKNGNKIPISIRKMQKAKEELRKYIKENARYF